MLQDLRYAWRFLMRRPGFTLVVVVMLALGVGLNTAVFSVADSVLFRPLPFDDVDRLAVLRVASATTGELYGMLPGDAIEAARAAGVFDGMGTASTRAWRTYVRQDAGLDAIALAPVSRAYLDLLHIEPALGRSFTELDAGSHAVLLFHRAWIGRYGGDPAVVGRSLPAILRRTERDPIDGQPLHIVGVLPPRLRLPLVADADGVILDDTLADNALADPPLVRLAAGRDLRSAQARLSALHTPALARDGLVLRLVGLREELARQQSTVYWLLLAASATLLMVACVNLTHLTLARGASRSRELAVRAALGGSRLQLARLLIAEAACIAALGGLVGVSFAYVGFRLLAWYLPPELASVADPVFDGRALAFASAVALTACALVSLVPVVRLSRAEAGEGLRSTGQACLPPHQWGRQVLVAAELAICLALVTGAGLVGRSLLTLVSEDLGFQPRRYVVTFDLPTLVAPHGNTVRTDTGARSAFYVARLHDVLAVPGVRAAALASAAPFSGIRPDAPLTDRAGQAGGVYSVSAGYFRTLGMPLMAGRDFTEGESFSQAPVGLLNESGARLLCGSVAQCLGRVVPSPHQPARTVIGVVADARASLKHKATPTMFVPFQSPFALKVLVIDADDDAATRARLTRALSVSRDARVDLQSLATARDLELSPFRFNALVVGAFALLTLLLAAVGVSGVMAAIVGERTREYGIRMALGATPERVSALVLRQAGVPIAVGALGGLLLSAWASRLAASVLYNVAPRDPVSFAAASLMVIACGVGATWWPAQRASRVDPAVVLKAE